MPHVAFILLLNAVWTQLFGQEILGYGQPNSLWQFSHGQVDPKVFSYPEMSYNLKKVY